MSKCKILYEPYRSAVHCKFADEEIYAQICQVIYSKLYGDCRAWLILIALKLQSYTAYQGKKLGKPDLFDTLLAV